MLDVRPAHCTLNCNLCAQVCPTDALHIPTPVEAEILGLGAVAQVDRNLCVAWARGRDCMACQSACPISGAIYSTEEYNPGWRTPGETRVPHVNAELCVACGQCTLVCPARVPAIQVVD
jgi:ferredoxin